MSGIVDRLLGLLEEKGTRQYGGERVSQCAHALQTAFCAEQAGAPPTLVAAALLHDIGHLHYGAGERTAAHGLDDRHEEVGAAQLVTVFGPAVADPVRLHVAAKRYLCTTDPAYFARLSESSVRSLELQGGPLTPTETAAFLSTPYAGDAIRLRQWDEMAKMPGLKTPDLEHYRAILPAVLLPHAATGSAVVGFARGNS